MALKLPFLFIIVLLATSSYAQKSETMERANAVPFPSNGKLVLEYTGVKEKPFTYQSASLAATQPIPKYFSFPRKNTNLEILAQFVNPLKTSLKLASKDSDDPNYQVEAAFAATVQPQIPTSSGFAAGGPPLIGLAHSALVPEWFDAVPVGTVTTTVEQNLAVLEDFLMGEFQIAGQQRSFEGHLTTAIQQMLDATDKSTFETARTSAITVRDFILNFRNTLDTKIANVKSAMTAASGTTAVANDNAAKKLKLLVTEFVRTKFIQFDSFSSLIDRATNITFKGIEIMLSKPSVELKEKKDLIITVSVTPLKVDMNSFKVTEGDVMNMEFTIILRRPQVEASAGVAWIANGIEFNSYAATEQDGSFKLSNTVTRKLFIPTAFLNVYRRATLDKYQTSEHLLILPQIGVGTGDELPTVLFGAGYVIPNRFVISGGLLNAWTQQLKDGYAENGTITEKDAEDITKVWDYKWVPKFYLSLQFKL